MTTIILIAFLGLVGGSFLILGLSPFEFAENISKIFKKKNKSIAVKIKEVTAPKKVKGIRKTLAETKEILTITGKTANFSMLSILSILLFIVGVLVSLMLKNYFLIPIVAIGFSMFPFWYVIFTANFYKKQLNAELETALSVITSSYLRSENIISAIEENIPYLNPPVSDVFRNFLSQTKLINSNIVVALENIKGQIYSDVFREWVNAVIACQEDKTLKTTLTPIISKLSDMRVVSAELDYLLYEPLKEFITMAILLIGNIPLMYFLNKDWYLTLTTSTIGKGILAICTLAVFVSMAAVIRLTRPIEYKR